MNVNQSLCNCKRVVWLLCDHCMNCKRVYFMVLVLINLFAKVCSDFTLPKWIFLFEKVQSQKYFEMDFLEVWKNIFDWWKIFSCKWFMYCLAVARELYACGIPRVSSVLEVARELWCWIQSKLTSLWTLPYHELV